MGARIDNRFSWEAEGGRIFVEDDPRRAAAEFSRQRRASAKASFEALGLLGFTKERSKAADDEEPPRQKKMGPKMRQHGAGYLATFRELYRSRDGRITVFEDGEGHITSVDSSRLV